MLLVTVSFLLILGSTLSMRKAAFSFKVFIPYLALCLLVPFLNVVYLVSNYFSGEGIDYAAMFHIRSGLSGAPLAENIDVISASAVILVLILLYVWSAISASKKNKEGKKKFAYQAYFLIICALLVSPAVHDIVKLYIKEKSLDMGTISAQEQSSIESVGSHKNLLYIYGESLEHTWSDTKEFPGLTPNLDLLKSKSIFFTNVTQTENDTFTVAGIVASQCGVSLNGTLYRKKQRTKGEYSTDVKCLADLLKKEGYFNSFYAANTTFAGKKDFLVDHGFDEIQNTKMFRNLATSSSQIGPWGMYDSRFLDIVYDRFVELAEKKEKFSLFTLTTTTHPPRGEYDPECANIKYEDGSNKLLNAVHCSDMQVARFINKVLESPYAKDTVIILASDHMAFGNVARDRLESTSKRTNRLMIFSPDIVGSTSVGTKGLTRDIAPTILPFIGFKGKLGMAKNLLEGIPRETYLQEK